MYNPQQVCLSCDCLHDDAATRKARFASFATDVEAARYVMSNRVGCFHEQSCYTPRSKGSSRSLWNALGFKVRVAELPVAWIEQVIDGWNRRFAVYGPHQVRRKQRRS